jgi:hypothetical protein
VRPTICVGEHTIAKLRNREAVKLNDATLLPADDLMHAPPPPSAVNEGGADELNAAYRERNQVVAALARCFPSGLKKTAIEGWDPAWHNCVYIDLPTGQASWHIHDDDAELFAGLPPYIGEWDGHSTPEKYERLAKLSRATENEGGEDYEARARETTDWILGFMEAECSLLPECVDWADRSNIANAILNALAGSAASARAETIAECRELAERLWVEADDLLDALDALAAAGQPQGARG